MDSTLTQHKFNYICPLRDVAREYCSNNIDENIRMSNFYLEVNNSENFAGITVQHDQTNQTNQTTYSFQYMEICDGLYKKIFIQGNNRSEPFKSGYICISQFISSKKYNAIEDLPYAVIINSTDGSFIESQIMFDVVVDCYKQIDNTFISKYVKEYVFNVKLNNIDSFDTVITNYQPHTMNLLDIVWYYCISNGNKFDYKQLASEISFLKNDHIYVDVRSDKYFRYIQDHFHYAYTNDKVYKYSFCLHPTSSNYSGHFDFAPNDRFTIRHKIADQYKNILPEKGKKRDVDGNFKEIAPNDVYVEIHVFVTYF